MTVRKIISTILISIAISFGIFFLSVIGYLNYDRKFSEEARRGKLNIRNALNIKVGMKKMDLIKIMGNPDVDTLNQCRYITHDESNPYLTFDIDSVNKVSAIDNAVFFYMKLEK